MLKQPDDGVDMVKRKDKARSITLDNNRNTQVYMRNSYPQWLPLEFQCRWCIGQIANSFITLMGAMRVPIRTRRNKT